MASTPPIILGSFARVPHSRDPFIKMKRNWVGQKEQQQTPSFILLLHIKLLYKNTTGLCARRKLKLKVKFNLLTKTLQSDNLPCDTTPPK